MHVASFAAALAVAGSTEFALTGAFTPAYRVTLTRRANAFGWAIYISTVAVLGPWCSVTPLGVRHERHRDQSRRARVLAALRRPALRVGKYHAAWVYSRPGHVKLGAQCRARALKGYQSPAAMWALDCQ